MDLTPGPLTIRPSIPEDAPLITAGIDTICREGGAFYITHFVMDSQWETALYYPENAPDHLLLVAYVGAEFAGSLNLFPAPTNSLSPHVAELGIFVLTPYRRRGIGQALMEQMLVWSSQTSLEKIVVRVFDTNIAALALYQKFTFLEEGRQHRHVKQHNTYVDLLWMAHFP